MNNAQRQTDYWTFRYCFTFNFDIIAVLYIIAIDLLYKLVYSMY